MQKWTCDDAGGRQLNVMRVFVYNYRARASSQSRLGQRISRHPGSTTKSLQVWRRVIRAHNLRLGATMKMKYLIRFAFICGSNGCASQSRALEALMSSSWFPGLPWYPPPSFGAAPCFSVLIASSSFLGQLHLQHPPLPSSSCLALVPQHTPP